MRYIVIGNTAVLASRGIDRISNTEDFTKVKVENVPDTATLTITGDNFSSPSYEVKSETANVYFLNLENGIYGVTVKWTTTEDGETIEHTAHGNPFTITGDAEGRFIIPTPLAGATETDKIWATITSILDTLLPLEDDVKKGSHVV